MSTPAPRRSLPVRVAASVGGALLLVVATVLFWLPEIALPVALLGLRLLAYQFEWALTAQGKLMIAVAEWRGRFASLSLVAKLAWCLVLAIVLVGIIALLFGG